MLFQPIKLQIFFIITIKDIKNNYLTTADYNKFTSNILHKKITSEKVVNESILNEEIKTWVTKEEMGTLTTKAELKAEQGKIVKLQTYDWSLFISQS